MMPEEIEPGKLYKHKENPFSIYTGCVDGLVIDCPICNENENSLDDMSITNQTKSVPHLLVSRLVLNDFRAVALPEPDGVANISFWNNFTRK